MRPTSRAERLRIVALDVGTKRVGIAMSDPLRLFAQPVGAFSPEETLRRIEEMADAGAIDRLIVGWPLTLEGEEGEAVAFVKAYVVRIENRVPGIRWIPWDERFTTEEARVTLRLSGARKRARQDKRRVDAASAALILQEYLDETERSAS